MTFQQVHESENSSSSVETVQDLHLVMEKNNIIQNHES